MTDRELQSRIRQSLDQHMPPLPDDPNLTEAVLERHHIKRQRRRHRMAALRIATAAMVIVLVVCGGAIMQSYTYMDMYRSEDNEQHVLIGVSVTPPFSQIADAELLRGETFQLVTKDLNELIAALGEAPLMPVWLPDGWELDEYNIYATFRVKNIVASYNKFRPNEQYPDSLVLITMIFSSMDDFYMAIESNDEGKYVTLDNGLSIYVDMNVERITSMWQDGLTGYTLSGDISEEELLHIIRSMYGLD